MIEAQIPENIWMWILGGTCGLIILLVSVIGAFILNAILKMKEEIKDFRIEFAEKMGEAMTWPKFAEVKKGMEKDREVEINLAISKHVEIYVHERAV